MIELKNISFRYRDAAPILRNVDLTVAASRAVALTGPNGCGKTTLLRILNGLAFPFAGEYRFDGARIDRESLKDARFAKTFHRRVGFVFQNADAQLFCGSVADEIAFGPRQTGAPEPEVARRVDDCLRLLGIENLRDRAPYTLSGGEKRKVAFAAVLALNPDVLTADEPLAGLDVPTQALVVDLLKSLRDAGKTLIFATHNRELVEKIADERVELDAGRIVRVES